MPAFWTPRGDFNFLIDPIVCGTFGLLAPAVTKGWQDAETTQEKCEGWAGICNDLTNPNAIAIGSRTLPKVFVDSWFHIRFGI